MSSCGSSRGLASSWQPWGWCCSTWPAIVETVALHFKLDTFVTNSVGRCFFKSAHHIGVGEGGEGGRGRAWWGSPPRYSCKRNYSHSPAQLSRFVALKYPENNFSPPIQISACHRTAHYLLRIDWQLWRKTIVKYNTHDHEIGIIWS